MSATTESLCRVIKTVIRGEHLEEKGHILHTGWKHAIAHCGVHVLPVSAIIVLSYFNSAGFFIGARLQGLLDGTSQAISRLCLQVTAKLLVSSCRYWTYTMY
jgi:hypothetical protein